MEKEDLEKGRELESSAVKTEEIRQERETEMSMKKIWKLAAVLLAFWLVLPAGIRLQAAGVRVIDDSDLFTDSEEAILEEEASRISEKFGTNVFILTSDEYGFSDNYARDVVEEYGPANYPAGYVAYCIDMGDRSYWVDAYGERERSYFTQSRTDAIAERAFDDLRDGDFFGSARAFLDKTERNFKVATSSMGPFAKLFVYPARTLVAGIIALIIALASAGIMTFSKVRKHADKNVRTEADEYQGGLNLTDRSDIFVRSYQTRVRRPRQTSSGGGFGGGGGSAGHTGSGGHF